MIPLDRWRKPAQYFDFGGRRIAYWAGAGTSP